MSGGKETPRQKMISMMYLVLNAMLALNVSVEVLKSFVTVNEAMEYTNQVSKKKSEAVYQIFYKAYMANEAKVGKAWNKAEQVQNKTKEFYDYLENVKYEVIAISEGISVEEAKNLNPKNIGRQDNYDDPTRYFIGENLVSQDGEAYKLRRKMEEYRLFLLDILGPDADKVSLAALETDGEYEDAGGQKLSWEQYNFYHTIIVADLALVNRIQASVLNAEYDVVSQLYSSVSADDFKFDTISARVVPVSTNVIVGTDFEADIFVAAFDSKSKITATINGQTYEGASGSIRYKVPATSLGDKQLKGTIEVPGTFGVKSYPFEIQYTVGQATATVAADAMNVFYVGVDNPVSAMAGGVADQNTRVEITNGTLQKTGPGTYIARVNKPGVNAEVKVYAIENGTETLMGSKVFRVKRVPDPVARINGQEVGVKNIDKNTLANAGGLLVNMKDFEFELKLQIASFNVQVSRNGELSPTMPSNGNKFTENMIDNFKRCRRGDKVFITDIAAQMPEGKRMLGDMVITIK